MLRAIITDLRHNPCIMVRCSLPPWTYGSLYLHDTVCTSALALLPNVAPLHLQSQQGLLGGQTHCAAVLASLTW